MRVRSVMLAAVSISSMVVGIARAQETDPPPPNVVVIITDDMRHDQMDDMPVLMSELVGKGRSFDRGFIVDPWCCPSRVSFLRGQYAHTTAVYDIDGPWGGWAQVREADIESEMLPVWLDRSGYYTALVGKYVNGYNELVQPPGWDYWRGKKGGYQDNFAFACLSPDPSCPTVSKWQSYSSSNPGYEATEVTNRAVEAIERSGTEPFFGWFAYFAPHTPMTPEPRYEQETEQCGDVDYRTTPAFDEAGTDVAVVDGLSGMKDKARWEKGRKAWKPTTATLEGYTRPLAACRSLLSVDDGLARIVAALEVKDPGLENTVIVFTSDQGVEYGEHNWSAKRVPYESTIRVPFVVRADGLFSESGTADASNIVLNIDLAPTVLELTGATGVPGCPAETQEPFHTRCVERGGGFDGRSFAPLLGVEVTPTAGFSDRVFLLEISDDATAFPEYCAVRGPDGKLIRYDKDFGPDWAGFDLTGAYGRADPNELWSVVWSSATAPDTPLFRGEVEGVPGAVGQALFDDLYPHLKALCDPLPPGYDYPFPEIVTP
jgi:arylsulfatase A-like enzyme